jgi:glycerophosphoryl diester phosphodiesterase
VVHDEDLERVTEGADPRRLESLTLAELRAVPLAGGERIPTLAEVLDLCADQNLLLNVEVKRDVPHRRRAVRATAAALRRRPKGSEVLVSSFDPFMLTGMAALARVPLALLLEPDHRYLAPLARGLRCVALHPFRKLVTRSLVARCHRAGLRVHAWTVNDFDEARRLLTLGVDGIITDDPARMRPLFR